MPERDGYIAGVPCWVDTSQPEARGRYLIARLRGGDVAAISSPPDGAPGQTVWNTYMRVDDADEAAAKAREAGGTVPSEPFDVMDAGRMALLADLKRAVMRR